MFWPEHDQSRARAGLRRARAALRKAPRQPFDGAQDEAQDAALGEGWLDVDREIACLNRDAEVWLDVAEFRERLAECRTHSHPEEEVCPACLPLLAEAAALYRDDFLAGFTLPDSYSRYQAPRGSICPPRHDHRNHTRPLDGPRADIGRLSDQSDRAWYFTWQETTLIFQPDSAYLEELTDHTATITSAANL